MVTRIRAHETHDHKKVIVTITDQTHAGTISSDVLELSKDQASILAVQLILAVSPTSAQEVIDSLTKEL